MAVFNPDVPKTQDPNYLNYSKVNEAPKADESSKYTYAGIGEGISGVVDIADTFEKGIIGDQVRDAVDTQRNQFTSALEMARNGSPASSTPVDAVGQPMSIMAGDSTGKPIPAALDQKLDSAANLPAALQGGHISKTYYDMNLAQSAKELRSQYPGYRDYIDQKFAQMTGGNPANEYVSSMIADINRNNTLAKEQIEKVSSQLRAQNADGVPGANVMLNAWEAKQVPEAKVNDFINNANSYKYQNATAKAKFESTERDKSTDTQNATKYATNVLATGMVSQFSALYKVSGMDEKDTLQNIALKLDSGELRQGDEQAQVLERQLLTNRDIFKQQKWAEFNKPLNKDGDTVFTLMGADKASALIDKQAEYFDNMAKRFHDHEYGWAHLNQNWAEGALHTSLATTLMTPGIGQVAAKANNLFKLFGPNWGSALGQEIFNTKLPDEIKGWLANDKLDLQLQPYLAPNGQPTTIKQKIDDAKAKGVTQPEYFDNLLDSVNTIRNPKANDDAKEKIAYAFFSPQNRHFLADNRFKQDYVDPQTGNKVPGNYSIFTRLTNPDITKEMFRLGQNKPELWTMYKNWAEETFGNDLMRTDLKNLPEIQDAGLHVKWTDRDNVHRIDITDANGASLKGPKNTLEHRTVDNINLGLNSLGNIEAAAHGDVGTYLLHYLTQSGIDLSKNTNGIPSKIVEAILVSRKAQEKKATDAKAIEDARPKSLSDTFAPLDTKSAGGGGFLE